MNKRELIEALIKSDLPDNTSIDICDETGKSHKIVNITEYSYGPTLELSIVEEV